MGDDVVVASVKRKGITVTVLSDSDGLGCGGDGERPGGGVGEL